MEFLEFDGCFNFDMVIGQEVTRTVFNDKNFRNFVDYRSIFRLVWKIQIKPRCSIARLNFPPCFINLDLETTANRCYFPSRNNISLFVIAGSFFSLFFFSSFHGIKWKFLRRAHNRHRDIIFPGNYPRFLRPRLDDASFVSAQRRRNEMAGNEAPDIRRRTGDRR